MKPRRVVACANLLGEAPLWDPRSGVLYWLDIKRRCLHWLDHASTENGCWPLEVEATAIGLRAAGGLVMAAGDGVGVFDLTSRTFERRVTVEANLPENRGNDGHVGADGRFWFGTMHDAAEKVSGALYCLDREWRLVQLEQHIGISNAMVTDAAARQLYVADSMHHVIFLYPIDSDSGALGSRQVFARTKPPATPDGAALDVEGCLWSAEWDGARVVRYTPGGSVERVIELPISRPTSVAFAGADLRTLYITSARIALDEQALAREPDAGGLFAVEVETPGLPLGMFEGR